MCGGRENPGRPPKGPPIRMGGLGNGGRIPGGGARCLSCGGINAGLVMWRPSPGAYGLKDNVDCPLSSLPPSGSGGGGGGGGGAKTEKKKKKALINK